MKIKNIIIMALVLAILPGIFGCGNNMDSMEQYNKPVSEQFEVDFKNPENVIQNALLSDKLYEFYECEVFSPVYKELVTKKQGNKTTYYILGSVGGYMFADDKLSRQAGGIAFPAVITLKEKDGSYSVTEYISGAYIMTQEHRREFIKENFPKVIKADNLINSNYIALYGKEEEAILKRFPDREDYVFEDESGRSDIIEISEDAAITLADYFEKYPDWVGKIQRVEHGEKYTYHTKYEEESFLKGKLTFTKTDIQGNEIECTVYKVDGNSVEKITVDE